MSCPDVIAEVVGLRVPVPRVVAVTALVPGFVQQFVVEVGALRTHPAVRVARTARGDERHERYAHGVSARTMHSHARSIAGTRPRCVLSEANVGLRIKPPRPFGTAAPKYAYARADIITFGRDVTQSNDAASGASTFRVGWCLWGGRSWQARLR